MTAIYGVWRFDQGGVAADFSRMDAALSRYGSDSHDVWSADPALSIGRRLHSSLPEDRFPAPVDSGRRYFVVADVRLTERDDLAAQLQLGAEAERMSDSAIAAAAIESWHEQAFDRIYGDFAIAAWDRQERRLLLARDFFGHKPLFFHRNEHFFAFASMPDGLRALPEVPLGPDMESMKRFLALARVAPGKTHYEGIGRVMPGHYAVVTPGEIAETRYWNPDLSPLALPTTGHYVDFLREHLDNAVAAALRGADSLVAAHLSSGLDTSAVATTAARLLATRSGKVVAYTAAPREGFDKALPGRISDESPLASATAAIHPNMEHVVIRSDRSPMENLARTASIYGVPVMNICNETWYDAINDDAARRGIGVMLEAALGNATISDSGILALSGLLQQGRFLSWLRLSARILRKGRFSLAKVLWLSFSSSLPNWLYQWLVTKHYGALMDPSTFSPLKSDQYRATAAEAAEESPVARSSRRVLANGWLRRNRNSLDERLELLNGDDSGPSCKGMLGEWKIDYRDPTTDRRLVEFSLRVPAEQFIHDGMPRALIRKALADRVPAEVLETPLRGHQAADWHEWFNRARDEVVNEVDRIEMFEPSAEIIDVQRLRELVDKWPEEGSEAWHEYDAVVDYRCCMLRSIAAASFMRQAARSNY